LAGFRFLVHPIRAIASLGLCILAAISWFAPPTVTAQAKAADGNGAPELRPLATVLTVERGITCLDSGELAEHVSSWLGTDRIAAPLSIDVHGSPYFARTVWFRIQRGHATVAERRFEPAPARCADLHAAVGLAISLALKASLLDAFIGARAPGEERVSHGSHPFRFGVAALGGVAVLPGVDLGVAISFQYAMAERFAVRLFALGLVGPRGNFQQDQGRFHTQLSLGRLDLCSRLASFTSVNISACAGIAAGAMNVAGEAFPMSRTALIPYLAIANALELDVALSRHWSLTLALDVLVPLRRTSFVVRDDVGAILAAHDLASAGVLLDIGPAYHF